MQYFKEYLKQICWIHISNNFQKSHTCEEGRAKPQNFCLAFIDELEKQLFIKKKFLYIKSVRNSIFTMSYFF